MLKVKKLDPRAKLPTVAHPGEDLAYDLYALEDVVLLLNETTSVHTGIAAQGYHRATKRQHWYSGIIGEFETVSWEPLGLLIRDRSSMAAKGIVVSGGVVDAGYTGEITVRLTNTWSENLYKQESKIPNVDSFAQGCKIEAGDKIAQMIPIPVLTGEVVEVEELRKSSRGDKGFGSSGK